MGKALGIMGACVLAVSLGVLASPALAVEERAFLVKTTGDLAQLCATPKTDPLYTAAINFCEGYAVGAINLNAAIEKAARKRPLICIGEPSPSRDSVVAEFIQWTQDNPKVQDQSAIQGLFEFLPRRFPCRR